MPRLNVYRSLKEISAAWTFKSSSTLTSFFLLQQLVLLLILFLIS
jgi:hypothetical protein